MCTCSGSKLALTSFYISAALNCGVLQCVAVCCRELQCVPAAAARSRSAHPIYQQLSIAVCCIVLQCVAVCCSVLQGVAVCTCSGSKLTLSSFYISVVHNHTPPIGIFARHVPIRILHHFMRNLQYVAVFYSMLQCFTVCYSVLQCYSTLQCAAV